jgi:streptogramin lyase
VLTAFLALSATLAHSAPASAKIECLGQPCRAKQVLAGRIVTDRATGREWFVLTNMNETSGAELLFIDYEKDTAQVHRAPAGAGSWALREVPGDRLVVGTFYDGQYMVFDLKQMKFVKTVGFPGESYIWNLAIGKDGRVYGGTYNGGKLGAFDLNTYTVEDCGAPAPPNLYLRYVSATPDGRLLCSFGSEQPTTRIYDPATKRFEVVPKHLEGVTWGAVWNGYFVAGKNAYQGTGLESVLPLPFPAPPADKGDWYVDVEMTTPDTLFLRQGNALYRYQTKESALQRLFEIDLRGGRLLASNAKGYVFGVRGQDYFVLRPGDTDLALRPIPAESAPRPSLFLKADAKGRLWGGPSFGQTLFWLDPRTKKATNTRTICDAGGEVYDVTFHAGKVYAAAYAGGDLVEYDPTQPWNQWRNTNPRTLVSLGPKGYIRPTGGIVTGKDGTLSSGWMAGYGTYGGAIAFTDPKTGKTDLLENPLGAQAIYGLAVDETFAYVGTSLSANGLPDKKGESPRFGMIDLMSRKVVFQQEFAGVSSVRACVYDRKTKRVGCVVGGAVRLFDPAARAFEEPVSDAPRLTSNGLVAPGNGTLYYGSEKELIALDIARRSVQRLAELPASITNVAVGPKGAIYAACGITLYRITPGR